MPCGRADVARILPEASAIDAWGPGNRQWLLDLAKSLIEGHNNSLNAQVVHLESVVVHLMGDIRLK